jgi:hypothetical protein
MTNVAFGGVTEWNVKEGQVQAGSVVSLPLSVKGLVRENP